MAINSFYPGFSAHFYYLQMSITGEPQVIHTVKSSWEILQSPVPLYSTSADHIVRLLPPISNSKSLKSECSVHLAEDKLKSLLPSSSTDRPFRTEHSQYTVESLHAFSTGSTVSQSSQRSLAKATEKVGLLDKNNTERMNTDSAISVNSKPNNSDTLEEESKEITSKGNATYVSSQRRPADDIADTVANEFEQYVKKSNRVSKKEEILTDAFGFPHLHKQIEAEDTENTDLHKVDHEESTLSKVSDSNFSTNSGQNKYSSSREDSEISRASERQNQIIPSTSSYSDHSEMSQHHKDGQRRGYTRGNDERRRLRHPPPQHSRNVETPGYNNQSSPKYVTNGEQTHRLLSLHSKSHQNEQSITGSLETSQGIEPVLAETEGFNQSQTSRENTDQSDARTSILEGMDHPHVPVSAGREEQFTRQIMPLPNVPPPNFHPPPTIIQNGKYHVKNLNKFALATTLFTLNFNKM